MQQGNADASLVTEIHDLLYRLGVRATHQGFLETSCAVFLVMRQREPLWFSIMDVYRQISDLYHTDLDVIAPRIRRIIRKIWRHHRATLHGLTGKELETVPTPRQFIQILCAYLYKRRPYRMSVRRQSRPREMSMRRR
ncbi:MAG: hypothetical protein IJR72_00795 [Oscillospiraceae bacterium]|nr:hypothetical protein [Oscillospiraceae bacterium]